MFPFSLRHTYREQVGIERGCDVILGGISEVVEAARRGGVINEIDIKICSFARQLRLAAGAIEILDRINLLQRHR